MNYIERIYDDEIIICHPEAQKGEQITIYGYVKFLQEKYADMKDFAMEMSKMLSRSKIPGASELVLNFNRFIGELKCHNTKEE